MDLSLHVLEELVPNLCKVFKLLLSAPPCNLLLKLDLLAQSGSVLEGSPHVHQLSREIVWSYDYLN
jgi:hypothetical protein